MLCILKHPFCTLGGGLVLKGVRLQLQPLFYAKGRPLIFRMSRLEYMSLQRIHHV